MFYSKINKKAITILREYSIRKNGINVRCIKTEKSKDKRRKTQKI